MIDLSHHQMYAGRIPAMNKAAEQNRLKVEPNMTKEQMNSCIPMETRWKADNYNHLLEQPTNFYAVVFALHALGVKDPVTVGLAWGECLRSPFGWEAVVERKGLWLILRFPS